MGTRRRGKGPKAKERSRKRLFRFQQFEAQRRLKKKLRLQGEQMEALPKKDVAILRVLQGGEREGLDLRSTLAARHSVRFTRPGFDQRMSKLRAAGYVECWTEEVVLHHEPAERKHYSLTDRGRRFLVLHDAE